MFAAHEPLRPKMEAIEEFAHVAWSIQVKVEICWSVAWSVAWILPQAHKAHKPNPIIEINLIQVVLGIPTADFIK